MSTSPITKWWRILLGSRSMLWIIATDHARCPDCGNCIYCKKPFIPDNEVPRNQNGEPDFSRVAYCWTVLPDAGFHWRGTA